MSAECPNGHGRQCIVANIGEPDKEIIHATDVIAQKLACGCIVGGPQYEDFQRKVHEIRMEEKKAIIALKEQTRQRLGAAFKAYTVESDE